MVGHEALITRYSDLALEFFLIWECDRLFIEHRLDEMKNSGLNTCKGGRQELVHSERIIYHQGKDRDGGLESWDVRGWWVAEGISGRATGITT